MITKFNIGDEVHVKGTKITGIEINMNNEIIYRIKVKSDIDFKDYYMFFTESDLEKIIDLGDRKEETK